MIYHKFYKNIISLKEQSEIIKIMFFYRYASLIITSTFYLLSDLDHSIPRKAFIVACISISSIMINYLYIKNESSTPKIILLVLIETIGNSFILIPSGGLNSPYVWYSLNTILIASVKLNMKYCWINLFIYLFNSTYMAQYLLGNGNNITSVTAEQSNLILSFILITAIILLLSKYIKKVEDKSLKLTEINKQLIAANKAIKDNMNYVMELYQAVHMFSTQENRDGLIQLIINHGGKIIKTNTIVFLHSIKNRNQVIIECKNGCEALKDSITKEILPAWDTIVDSEIPVKIEIKDKEFIFTCLRCNYKVYGILGMDITGVNDKEVIEQLRFLTSLSSITLEKFELEQVNEALLINQEQNRIANEIHDGILQRLFSISCGMFGAIKNLGKINTNQTEAELNVIRGSIQNVMKDLRSTIYGLSWKKDGLNNFIVNIENYIYEMKVLNDIDIQFHVEGNHELLSIMQKKAIYRIICEAIGNAVRHGKAKMIEVILIIGANTISLEIVDNGVGFETKSVEGEKVGLGIKNIYLLTHSLNGIISIDSNIGVGTRIDITIPNSIQQLYEEEVV